MTPTPEDLTSVAPDSVGSQQLDGNKIVISGMSGLYPQAHNIKEFSEILYNKVNPIVLQETRWIYKHPELSDYLGIAPDENRFDAQFFTVHQRLGHYMDPMCRKILEHTHQALYDAGINPGYIYGQRVGVVIGVSCSDTEKYGFMNVKDRSGLAIVGISKTMCANRISYWLNVKGTSMTIDELDCSSTLALDHAYSALKRGDCEIAIVGGANMNLLPHGNIHHRRFGVLSRDGKTKSFAENANGFTLSDGVGVLILQKAKDAMRCYAELVHVKNEFLSVVSDENGPHFGFHRDPEVTANFIRDFYKEALVPPQAIEYVEAYGTAVPEADKSELEAFEKVFCENRDVPLLVGSVMSNVGFTGAATGITAMTKVLLGYHKGELAGNLNCEKPRKDIAALRDGRMRIITENQLFRRGYTAINIMSITGVNSHVLLCGHYKPKDLSAYKSSIPRLIVLSGRMETSVQKMFDNLKSRPIDPEEIALLHNLHTKNLSSHLGRGYIVLDTDADNKTVTLCEKAEYYNDAKRPLWFVYSGLGSQWTTMGVQLMRIPIFASAIKRCHEVLEPKGLDIVNIITSSDSTIFDNMLNTFVGVAAVQIGLTDILRALDLVPDGIIGHSVGELGCAYADGCLSTKEMILTAYYRGLASLQTPLIKGAMAAIGLGYKQILPLCPPEIDVACHNGPTSSTISGPADIMHSFIAELTSKTIFVREIPSSSIAYHSRYIADAGLNLLKYLKEVIKNPKRRSERWLSTSVPQHEWDEVSSQYCSAEYHTNNLMSPVLFEETLRLVPYNAVLVEVAPHGILQAILKRSLSKDCRHVALNRRDHADNTLHLLQTIGSLYMSGFTPNVQALYPKVQFPVSTETPMLSHLVDWVHTEKWEVISFNLGKKNKSAICKFVKSIHDDDHSYLQGHVIREKMCYPFAAALVAVWDTFVMSIGPKRGISVQFSDVNMYAQPLLLDQRVLRLYVAIQRGTGQFEVLSESSRVISGLIKINSVKEQDILNSVFDNNSDIFSEMEVKSKAIYQFLNDREYQYSGKFRSIECASSSLDEAAIVWDDNWVTLIDGMLQLNALRLPHHAVSQATHIGLLDIHVEKHERSNKINKNGKIIMKAVVADIYNLTRCGGVSMLNVSFCHLPSIHQNQQLGFSASLSQVNQMSFTAYNALAVNNKMLQCAEIGKLDSLQWIKVPKLKHSNLTVKVHFAGLNLLDVKRAAGVISYNSNSYGMDFSGTTKNGERVMGIVANGAASSQLLAQSELLWPVPAHWSLEDAATVPLPYAHAFYALKIKGGLRPGMRVLVHGGTGALGQAAIAIALAQNCQVFTTVSDVRKKQFLRKLFPEIKDEHIGNSRDLSFYCTVMTATKGQGCNIIISCVKGEFKEMSVKCCGLLGIFIDTVQINEREKFTYGMYGLEMDRSYFPTDFSSIFTQNLYNEMQAIQNMLREGISAGYVVPLTRVTYAPHEAARAFGLLGFSRHRGRVLLKMCDDAIQTQHRLICDPEQCQVLFWDNDAYGVQLANRLIHRGARKLYINCTKFTTYLHLKLRAWQQQFGIQVLVSEDLTKSLLNDALTLGNIEGIYISMSETHENLSTILKNLDSESKSLCSKLRYFTLATTVKDLGRDICLSRVKSGLTATYLDLSSLNETELKKGHTFVEIIDLALCNKLNELTKNSEENVPTLVEQVAALAGIHISPNTDSIISLLKLGMDYEKSQSISTYLNDKYNISLDETVIPFLTIDKLKKLHNSVSETPIPDIRGLRTFFFNIDYDTIAATIDFVLLPTLYTDDILLDGFGTGERCLCIVPGIEGNHLRFHALCERLKMPALVLQPGLDQPHETVRQTALRYAEILQNKTELQDNFYLLGYENGVSVALELAAILEEQGLTGTVFCLGFAPAELQAEVEEHLIDLGTEEQLQDAVVRHMFTLMAGEDETMIDNALQQAATWTEKVDTCLQYLRGRTKLSLQYVRALIEAAPIRIEQMLRYSPPEYCLRSQLVLLRAATTQVPKHATTLQQYTQKPIIVHQLGSPLSYILNDTQCASLVNRYLDEGVQKAFDTKNLCQFSSEETCISNCFN